MADAILTSERLRELLQYDSETGIFTWKTKQKSNRSGGLNSVAGYKKSGGYICIMIDGKNLRAHRLAWLWTNGSWPTLDLDHINGDTSDNRMSNLREVTAKQNQENRHRSVRSKSGCIGVSWNKSRSKWYASITHNRKTLGLGLHDTLDAAVRARKKAESEIYTHSQACSRVDSDWIRAIIS
jgi:hypothetical protein